MVISHFASRSLLAALHGLETAVVTSYQAPEGRQIQHGKDSKNPAANPNLVFVLLEFPSWVGKIMQNSRELHLKKTNVGCRFHRGVTCRPLFFCFTPRVQLTLSTPEPKPDTRDTHVLLDGNLGWGPTYDTRIRGMKICLHLHCLF